VPRNRIGVGYEGKFSHSMHRDRICRFLLRLLHRRREPHPPISMHRRLFGLQSRFWSRDMENNSTPPRNRTPVVQLVASNFNDMTVIAHTVCSVCLTRPTSFASLVRSFNNCNFGDPMRKGSFKNELWICLGPFQYAVPQLSGDYPKISHDTKFLVQDSNRGPPKYESGCLNTTPRH
jgi:hypothetical protein